MLMMKTKALGVSTVDEHILPKISDNPLTPPVEKLFGNLKKYTPTAISNTPNVRKIYRLIVPIGFASVVFIDNIFLSLTHKNEKLRIFVCLS